MPPIDATNVGSLLQLLLATISSNPVHGTLHMHTAHGTAPTTRTMLQYQYPNSWLNRESAAESHTPFRFPRRRAVAAETTPSYWSNVLTLTSQSSNFQFLHQSNKQKQASKRG